MSEAEAGRDKLEIDNMFLCGSQFSRVSLKGATFGDSHLMEARFDDVNMSAMVLDNVNMSGTTINNANLSDVAITSRMNPISSGSLIGVRKRTIESAPRRPSERGSENCTLTKMAVIASPIKGNAWWTCEPVARDR